MIDLIEKYVTLAMVFSRKWPKHKFDKENDGCWIKYNFLFNFRGIKF